MLILVVAFLIGQQRFPWLILTPAPYPRFPSHHPFTISDDEVLSKDPSSPLSTALDINVIDTGRWLVSLAGCKTLVKPIRKKITLARRAACNSEAE